MVKNTDTIMKYTDIGPDMANDCIKDDESNLDIIDWKVLFGDGNNARTKNSNMKQYQAVEDLMDSCVQYFEQQSYSPLRIDRYKFLWKNKLIPFMIQKSILNYDPSVGAEYVRSKIAGSIVTPYERDIIRSLHVLNEFQEKGTISKTNRKHIKRELSGQIGRLMDKFLLHLESVPPKRKLQPANRAWQERQILQES